MGNICLTKQVLPLIVPPSPKVRKALKSYTSQSVLAYIHPIKLDNVVYDDIAVELTIADNIIEIQQTQLNKIITECSKSIVFQQCTDVMSKSPNSLRWVVVYPPEFLCALTPRSINESSLDDFKPSTPTAQSNSSSATISPRIDELSPTKPKSFATVRRESIEAFNMELTINVQKNFFFASYDEDSSTLYWTLPSNVDYIPWFTLTSNSTRHYTRNSFLAWINSSFFAAHLGNESSLWRYLVM
jgi:hypothetical protein